MYDYIIYDVEGVKKPIIEHYIKCQNNIECIINKDTNVIDWEQELDDVNYDYDFIVSFINNDNIYNNIYNLKNKLEALLPITIHLLNEQIEDQMLNEAEEEVIIDFYINLQK